MKYVPIATSINPKPLKQTLIHTGFGKFEISYKCELLREFLLNCGLL